MPRGSSTPQTSYLRPRPEEHTNTEGGWGGRMQRIHPGTNLDALHFKHGRDQTIKGIEEQSASVGWRQGRERHTVDRELRMVPGRAGLRVPDVDAPPGCGVDRDRDVAPLPYLDARRAQSLGLT